jgi:hypothetical protein
MWKVTEKKPPFALDSGVPMVRHYPHILADSCPYEGRLHPPRQQIRGEQIYALCRRM